MSKAKLILQGSRPLTWALSVCPIIIASLCAGMDSFFAPLSIYSRSSRWILLIFLSIIVALSLQICANFFNDYFDGIRGVDANRSDTSPVRLNSVDSGALVALKASLGALCIGVVAGVAAVNISRQYWLIVVGIICSIVALAYSTWFSALGLGELLAFIFFGPVVVWSVEYMIIRHLGPWAILSGIQCGLIAAAVLLINNMRDQYSDASGGKITIVVRWGRDIARRLLIITLTIIWGMSLCQIIGAIMGVNGQTAAWIMVIYTVIFGCAIALSAWIIINIFRADNRPALYKNAFMGVNGLMILLMLHYIVVFVVANAL
ncbi:1,4-dihydroxy-2-naphthoate octaprenyltransferase [Alloscardovia theropitheci]|uniref:1,4-dihydroxy-2-naphthoate octaprenyltransferase n=1 Tax=Alloscardovia theropitheci TaxID=2496842 RepID=A0A4R0QX13_9BIFI|nr:1,4-dihydroxy-2-naphthoate octaprenyltransferase [Alloscardovia theropitheci]TCD54080.1 1,4-dihydroxy-2-naphthoate octaprenyltransferase [Alloscardovia theropitheci]